MNTKELTIQACAELVQGRVQGPGELHLRGLAPADTAQEGDLTFAENSAYFQKALASRASAILTSETDVTTDKPLIIVTQVRVALAKLLVHFYPEPKPMPGLHPSAVVDPTATVDPSASIGPHCVVGPRCILGEGVILHGGNHIGEDSQLGPQTELFPNVVVYRGSRIGARVRIHAGSVIGSDGYGYVLDQGQHRKIPQVGHVEIEDDVEIGANVTIDRGALGPTRIAQGAKIDNLVQIAHNVQVGAHSLLISQVGVAGSTQIGRYAILAGQVGVAGHLKIGNQAVVAAQSGVMHSIPDGEKWMGSPAQPDRQAKRQLLALQKLPQTLRAVKSSGKEE